MSVETDKLERFSKAVYKEVNEKVSDILNEAESSRQEILKKVSDKSLDISFDIMQDEIKKINQKYVREVAKVDLEAKREVLLHRDELTKLIFTDIKFKVNEFTRSDKYETFLEKKLKEALCDASSDEEVVVYLSSKDMPFADHLKNSTSHKNIKFEQDSSIKLGGLSVLYVKGNIMNDKTLDSAIEDEKEKFNLGARLKID